MLGNRQVCLNDTLKTWMINILITWPMTLPNVNSDLANVNLPSTTTSTTPFFVLDHHDHHLPHRCLPFLLPSLPPLHPLSSPSSPQFFLPWLHLPAMATYAMPISNHAVGCAIPCLPNYWNYLWGPGATHKMWCMVWDCLNNMPFSGSLSIQHH